MSRTRARIVKLYEFTCDNCRLKVEYQAEGPASRPLREPVVAPPAYKDDPEKRSTKGAAWRSLTLNQALRQRAEGFVCSDECAVGWLKDHAPIDQPEPVAAKEAS